MESNDNTIENTQAEVENVGKSEKNKSKRKFEDTLLSSIIEVFVLVLMGQIIGGFLIGIMSGAVPALQESDVWLTGGMYLMFIGIWAVALLWIGLNKRTRSILRVVGTKPEGNNWFLLLFGILIGFGLNGLCILIAWLNKDIVLYFDSFRPLPLVFIFITVFIQSSAEELVCRGYLFQKLWKNYQKPAVAIVGNSLFFAILHLGNEGVTVFSLLNIFLVGIFCSLVVYYMDSLWCAFAIHTAWNFTQNILFGLPNSGMVVPFSVFKLDASTAKDSFAYNVGFGIEGTIVADVVFLLGCVILFLWGKKYGKKPYDVWAEETEA